MRTRVSMTRWGLPTALLVLTGVLMGCAHQEPAGETEATLAIANVNVVPMDQERVIPDQTVLIRGNRIVAMDAASRLSAPAGATVVDGEGRYLMPGLVDMHIHAVQGTGEPGDAAWRQMALLVANGVTTARSLAGAPTASSLREGIRAGRVIGPELYLAGPSLNYNSVATPESARAAVREQAANGFDFLKTHGVSGEVYDAIVETAAAEGMRLVGHVMPDYGLSRAMAAGQQIEHLDGYLPATIPATAGIPTPPGQFFLGPELDHMTERAMPELARQTVEAGIWNSPTLALFEIVADPRPVDHYLSLPETRYVSGEARDAWAGQLAQLSNAPVSAERRARYLQLRQAMALALRDAGAGLMAGSDSPQLFMAPGFALHRELDALQRAGLTPYQTLQTATSNPARYIGPAARFGTVAEGGEADLLLLDANPLEDVANARRIHGVVLDGRWIPAAEIEALKEAVAASVETSPEAASAGAAESAGSAANGESAAGRSADVGSAGELIRAMHDRYEDRWYRTLSFRQRVIRTAPDGSAAPEEVWYERAAIPGRLRIDFGEAYSGSGVLYAQDSLYVFRDGELAQRAAQRNPLLILGFDVYGQPPQTTMRQLEEEGFDLTRFHSTTHEGRPVYVVGADEGDLNSPQFWVDAERLLFLRLIAPLAQDSSRTSEITFEDYTELGGGWIAPLVIFRVDGQETMREEYFDMVPNRQIPEHVFDPDRWTEAQGS